MSKSCHNCGAICDNAGKFGLLCNLWLPDCSIRGQQWHEFANTVSEHIEQYTVPQYGDAGDDLCTDYTVEHCIAQMKKYLSRHGKNSRPGQDQLDLIKIAHYAQMAWELSRGK